MNARFFARLGLSAIGLLLLSACGGAGAPSRDDIRTAFEQEMPGLLELKEFSLEQHRNTGSEERPVWVARVIATLAMREATYEIETVEGDVRLLKPVRAAGETFNTYGTVHSERAGETWRHRFQTDRSSNPVLGRPRSDYGPDALLSDSPEARTLLAKIAEEKEQARIAEETRIAAEAAELKRQEEADAAKRQRIEAAVARHGAAFAPRTISGNGYEDGIKLRFLVTARSSGNGQVWGTDLYRRDSDFSKSVVHAGLLKDGETGIVEVTTTPRQGGGQFNGTPRNGVNTSNARESYGYTMRLIERIASE